MEKAKVERQRRAPSPKTGSGAIDVVYNKKCSLSHPTGRKPVPLLKLDHVVK